VFQAALTLTGCGPLCFCLGVCRRSDKQFLDKQDFLKRAELREYEIERDKRLASDVRLRGRL